jgi:hypothetical protein
MALFFEPMQECAQKCLTRADIVRDAIFRQLLCFCPKTRIPIDENKATIGEIGICLTNEI